jgi:hypothetical protein
LALSIFCHIAGNAIGNRLRQMGDLPDGNLGDDPVRPVRVPAKPQDFAPATRLSQRQSLGWAIVVASSVGATSGAIGGGFWTFWSARGPVGPVDIFVGVIAFSVLGGLAAFAVFGFAQVLLGAVWQALHAPTSAARHESPTK